MQPDCTAVNSRLAFPFFDQSKLEDLKAELPHYLAAVENISPTYDPMEFWKTHELSLRSWAEAARKVQLLVQPSSAASERAFSLLTSSFSHQKNSARFY
jgi:hypothetical protein